MRYATHDPLSADALVAEVAGPERGATSLFLGTVRRGPDDGPVVRIEYSAYEPMLEAEFARIVEEAEARWPGTRVAACHRLGPVALGAVSIGVAAGAPHRAEALAACRYVIEEAKARLPVWKREIFEDGGAAWRDNSGGRSASVPPPPAR